MIITRDDVLQAIDKEPLVGGRFVDIRGRPSDVPCSVCAVGAVLRNKGFADADIAKAGLKVTKNICDRDDASLPHLLTEGLYLSALSVFWERLVDGIIISEWMDLAAKYTAKLKPQLREWVLENLPDGVLYEGEV